MKKITIHGHKINRKIKQQELNISAVYFHHLGVLHDVGAVIRKKNIPIVRYKRKTSGNSCVCASQDTLDVIVVLVASKMYVI